MERFVSVGGREIYLNFCLYDEIFVFDFKIILNSFLNRLEIVFLFSVLSYMQVVVYNNFFYVFGGCIIQCAYGEFVVNLVMRYDFRFDSWF